MTIAWMMYGLFAAGLIGLAAVAVERGTQPVRWSVRWVWCAAIAATAVLMALVPLRARTTVYFGAAGIERATPVSHGRGAVPSPIWRPMTVPTSEGPVTRLLSRLMAPRSSLVEESVAVGWMVSSVLLLVLLATVVRRYADARLEWPAEEIDGVLVHVSPEAGPAVLGFFKPWITVPAWLLDRPDHEQRLVVAHEQEHLQAGDHYLMAVAWLIVALMPWNVVAWWMVVRLRLAIELDCDRRMLRRGVSAHTYGLLLIDVASEYRGLSLGATAFASRPSQLERRIRAMRPARNRFVGGKATFLTLVAVSAVCLVNGTPLPQKDSFQPPRVPVNVIGGATFAPARSWTNQPGWGPDAFSWALSGAYVVDTVTPVTRDSGHAGYAAKPSVAGQR